jgi:hypothetical protein
MYFYKQSLLNRGWAYPNPLAPVPAAPGTLSLSTHHQHHHHHYYYHQHPNHYTHLLAYLGLIVRYTEPGSSMFELVGWRIVRRPQGADDMCPWQLHTPIAHPIGEAVVAAHTNHLNRLGGLGCEYDYQGVYVFVQTVQSARGGSWGTNLVSLFCWEGVTF